MFYGQVRLFSSKGQLRNLSESWVLLTRKNIAGTSRFCSLSPHIALCYGSHSTASPSSVALVLPVIRTLTYSPIWWLPLSNTTILFCSVRPHNCSLLRLLGPSTKTSNTLPSSFLFEIAESWVCS